jgi:hypothetical protein
MATENRDWGYRRIQGALANLSHEVAPGTIANILKEHGLEPVPERNRKTTGKEFLARPREVIAAADFFTLEAWTPKGLTRFLVLFLIDLSSRKVEIGGVARQTKGLGMILFGEGSLRKAIHDFVWHDHHESNHPGLDNRLILQEESYASRTGAIPRRPRLSGMLNHSYRLAA